MFTYKPSQLWNKISYFQWSLFLPYQVIKEEICKYRKRLSEKYRGIGVSPMCQELSAPLFNRVWIAAYFTQLCTNEIQSMTTQRWPTSSSDDNSEMCTSLPYFKIHLTTYRKSSSFVFFQQLLCCMGIFILAIKFNR